MVKIEYIVQSANLCGMAMHEHEKWELMYCTKGEVSLKYNDKQYNYSKNHAVLIPPGINHSNIALTDDAVLIRTVIDADDGVTASEPLPLDDSLDKDLGNLLEMCAKYFSYGPLMQLKIILDSYSILIANRIAELIKFSNRSQMVVDIAKDIMNNFQNPEYALEDTFDKYPLSKDYIRRQFIKEQGISPIQFLTNTRISHAMNLLRTRYLNKKKINEIAMESGFTDQLYFSRVFHKVVGMSPREYSDNSQSDNKDLD